MDDSVRRALVRWPDVPHCYGWLSLDRAGRWRLQNEIVRHHGLADFIARNYLNDDAGRWFFQNGPQRAYVRLDYTPWILRTDADGSLRTHAGGRFDSPEAAWLDEDGNLLISGPLGVGLVHGHDLVALADAIRAPEGDEPGELALAGGSLAILPIISTDVPRRFGFQQDPQPTA
jgi:hypothetical protein